MSSDPPDSKPVIYEVDLTIDAAVVAEFDDWLAGHVGQMLSLPGFESADIERVETDDADAARRSVRYRLSSRGALDEYLATHAARMRADGLARFGDAMRASRRILEPSPAPDNALVPVPRGEPLVDPAVDPVADPAGACSNCSEPLTGQYCYQCGQRDKHRLISLWELLRDLIGDVFEVDSRVWRTVFPLTFRPGFLTLEYLSGRRVHYTPPLRMYLVLSLVFFVVAGLGGEIRIDDESQEADLSISLSSDDDETTGVPDADESPGSYATSGRALSDREREQLRELKRLADSGQVPGLEKIPDLRELENLDDTGELQTLDDVAERCQDLKTDIPWLNSPAAQARIKRTCERLTAEGGLARFANKLRDNLPAMMFLFLPLIALVMKALYIGSRRYYVEHLLFVVHFHSFFFLALTVTVLTGMVPATVPASGVVHGLLIAAVSIYAPIYLFRSMRAVYGQWWIVTFAKYLALFVAYLVCLLATFLLGALVTALTV